MALAQIAEPGPPAMPQAQDGLAISRLRRMQPAFPGADGLACDTEAPGQLIDRDPAEATAQTPNAIRERRRRGHDAEGAGRTGRVEILGRASRDRRGLVFQGEKGAPAAAVRGSAALLPAREPAVPDAERVGEPPLRPRERLADLTQA